VYFEKMRSLQKHSHHVVHGFVDIFTIFDKKKGESQQEHPHQKRRGHPRFDVGVLTSTSRKGGG